MKQKLKVYFSPNNILKSFLWVLIFIWIFSKWFASNSDSISFPGMYTPVPPPAIVLTNAGPCSASNRVLLENFIEGKPQSICADVKSDVEPVNLNLYIYKLIGEYKFQIYLTRSEIRNGPMVFDVKPLKVGKYHGEITWARTVLVEFDFDVVAESP